MLSIGDFARIGMVSVRMLRHYDRVGLLTPAAVDVHSGYRSYDVEQLARLNRIIALKDLGFTLEEVSTLIDEQLEVEELRGMLRIRRAQLATDYEQAATRLIGVEHRLRLIEKENRMSEIEYVRKPLPAVRLAAGIGSVDDRAEIAETIEPLFQQAADAVMAAGGSLTTAFAAYEEDEGGMKIIAGYQHPVGEVAGATMVELPAVPDALCAVHLGPMVGIGESWQALHHAIAESNLVPSGPPRENYLRAEPAFDQSEWVTELQQPVEPAES